MRPGYRTARNGRLWAVHHEHCGPLADDRECESAAEALADEHAAAMDQSDADEAAAIAAHDESLRMKAAA